jgi:ribulose-phosphate 3-epimerase
MTIAIAPSILLADFTRLGEEVRALTRAGADLLHVDVMDGHFVPHLTIGPFMVGAMRKATALPLDVHLMVEHPERYVAHLAGAGASTVSVHPEACDDLRAVLAQIRAKGMQAGVALNPDTPIDTLDPVLDAVDVVLIMTVHPGQDGQKPIPAAIEKIAKTKCYLTERSAERITIEADGGISAENARDFAAADVLVSGSGILSWPKQVENQAKSALNEDQLAASYTRAIAALRTGALG